MMFSAEELLRKNGIEWKLTKKPSYTTNCPSCRGGYLSVKTERDRVMWFCHNCDFKGAEFFDQKQRQKTNGKTSDDLGPIKATFDYEDELGKRLYQVLRFEPLHGPKTFRQRTGPDQEHWSIKGVRLVPFKLPQLLEEIATEQIIFIVEGEKDVLTLRSLGIPATCNAMGALKWQAEWGEKIFAGADVVLCGDNDQPGRDHMDDIARKLYGKAKRIRLLNLKTFCPVIEESDDVSDWLLKHDGTVEKLWDIVGILSDWSPQARPRSFLILSKAEFLAGWVPPDYQIDGIMQKSFIYALTGPTGHAKTAIAMLLAELISAPGSHFLGTHRVEPGRVVYFAGENPEDLRMRVIGADSKRNGSDRPLEDQISFIPGNNFNLSEISEALSRDIAKLGGCQFVVIDTSAAYFLGNEELNNTQMGNHARMLRTLTTLPGRPCVLVLCHPIKYVQEAYQLLPRGGGAFLAEMDGNLTAWKHDDMVELHYNKMRGPGFEPMTFKLEPIRTEKLVDSKGRELPTVRAVYMSQDDEDLQTRKTREERDHVLAARLKIPDEQPLSHTRIAESLGWFFSSGDPAKSKVQKIIEAMGRLKPAWMRNDGGQWVLTERGKEEARKAALRIRAKEELEAARREQSEMFH